MKLVVVLLLIMMTTSLSLWCVDGSDCDVTCSFCEGAACLRVQRQHPTGRVSTAMTCLPHDSLIHAYHPEGCRTDLSTGEKLCLCSGRDFCNPATKTDLSLLLSVLAIVLL
ncbi:hypothetical protein KIN20_034176 [Parelaphostrongylus tenuis]|uniref:Uncharacterized protein n=1 Tax=Parelaphostrongylus tenuis TaxID=148309 RepID=A0AAD5R9R3_PARTN|nr:hypothetical protein KIN20_034176 [Parelaphostrongylus tenuis]